MTIHGAIQINNAGAKVTFDADGNPNGAGAGHDGAASCHATGNGAAYNACVITYMAGPTDNVYLCTYVEMGKGADRDFYVFDEDDNSANGNQCGLAISVGA